MVFVHRIRHLILPALTLGIGIFGEYALIVRSAMLETLGEDYILTARAKGLKNWSTVWTHAFRNALLPLITLIALWLGYILAGAIVIEEVFSYPGYRAGQQYDAINRPRLPCSPGSPSCC